MSDRISRRDFLDASLLASGAALLSGVRPLDVLAARRQEWDGYGGVGDYAGANGNTYEVVAAGHALRDGAYEHLKEAEIRDAGAFDCVVVGGGISGLAAALFFHRESTPGSTCLVLENHSIFGGLARQNEFVVDGRRLVAHQASTLFFPPLAGSFLEEFYRSIGIDSSTFEYQAVKSVRPNLAVGTTPYFSGGPSSAYYFGEKFGRTPGVLLVDPIGKRLEGAPIAAETRAELLALERGGGSNGLPKTHGDAASRRLDAMTLEQHIMETSAVKRETVRTFLSPVAGGGSGLGPDALSAYSDYAADVLLPWEYSKGAQMFPGGNTGVARHIVKTLIPESIPGPNTRANVCCAHLRKGTLDRSNAPTRIRSGCTVVAVEHGDGSAHDPTVRVVYARSGRLYAVRARAVVMAGGSWTTKHVVRDLPASHREAYGQFYRSPCLVASVAVRNWRFLAKLGISECRWYEGIGNYAAVRRVATFGPVEAAISPDSPVVLTLKILFSYPGEPIGEQVARGRAELLATPFRDYESRIREQFTEMFAAGGFDARRDIAGIILNRWGHAYLSPQPGFFFGSNGRPAPGEVLRNEPVGRVAFANSDVTGIMDHRASILEAKRAVGQLVERLR